MLFELFKGCAKDHFMKFDTIEAEDLAEAAVLAQKKYPNTYLRINGFGYFVEIKKDSKDLDIENLRSVIPESL